MSDDGMQRLAIIVRSGPWQERSGREALDLAMAAVTMDVPLDLYFIGDGLLQLLAGQQPAAAALPTGLKAWASLEDLGVVRIFAEKEKLESLQQKGQTLFLDAQLMSAGDMARMQGQADHVVVA